jgi:tetratricopeptide (TPR) repeat protein
MNRLSRFVSVFPAALLMVCGVLLAQSPSGQSAGETGPAAALLKEARTLNREGKHSEALARYRQALKISPNSLPALAGAGATLDLMGEYDQARAEFSKAIAAAPPKMRPRALKMMAISYAFTCQPEESEKYEQQAFDQQIGEKDFYAAGETADELARIYIECGNLDAAQKWYQKGHDTGLEKPGITEAQKALWDFRLQHALARIAARRGQRAEAEKHVAEARALLAKGYKWEKQQAQYLPYLTGYVAFYLGDYKTALADFQKANQRDPFILSMIAQTYEKLGDKAQAMDYFRKVLRSSAHNPPNAFARPLAMKMVGAAPAGG